MGVRLWTSDSASLRGRKVRGSHPFSSVDGKSSTWRCFKVLRSGPAHSGCGPSGQTVPPGDSEPTWESGCGSELSHCGGMEASSVCMGGCGVSPMAGVGLPLGRARGQRGGS